MARVGDNGPGGTERTGAGAGASLQPGQRVLAQGIRERLKTRRSDLVTVEVEPLQWRCSPAAEGPDEGGHAGVADCIVGEGQARQICERAACHGTGKRIEPVVADTILFKREML